MASLTAGTTLTIEDMRRAISAPYRPDTSLIEMLLNTDPTPHLVKYQGTVHFYVPPHCFRFDRADPHPSDCTWMVPNLPGSRP